MRAMGAETAMQDFETLIERVNDDCTPVAITVDYGKSAVLIGADEWSAIQETLYLNSMPGVAESIVAGMNASISEFVAEEELEW